jgi:hypothetical protein
MKMGAQETAHCYRRPGGNALAVLEDGPDSQDLTVESAVMSGLGLLGETGRSAMLFYLVRRGVSLESIPSRMPDLVEVLVEILGPGAEIVEAQIAAAIRSNLNGRRSIRTTETLRILEDGGTGQGSRANGESLPP